MAEKNSPAQTPAIGEFRTVRTFDAPRELLFRVWTEPEHLFKWWGPKGFTLHSCKLDLRPGGVFLYGMRAPDGSNMWGRWVIQEIRPPERLVFIVSFADADGNPVRHPFSPTWPMGMFSTLTLEEDNGRTTLTLTATAHEASALERQTFIAGKTSMTQGWKGTFDQLDAYLQQPVSQPLEASSAMTKPPGQRPEAENEILTTRLIDAPRALVFDAWTDPKQVALWWGPDGFTNTIREMNVTPGGVWRFIMHGPDGVDYPNRIVFIEVVKPERLVYDHSGEGEYSDTQFHVTVTFDDQGGKTMLSMRARFGSAAQRNKVAEEHGAIEGAKQHLNRLVEHLAKR